MGISNRHGRHPRRRAWGWFTNADTEVGYTRGNFFEPGRSYSVVLYSSDRDSFWRPAGYLLPYWTQHRLVPDPLGLDTPWDPSTHTPLSQLLGCASDRLLPLRLTCCQRTPPQRGNPRRLPTCGVVAGGRPIQSTGTSGRGQFTGTTIVPFILVPFSSLAAGPHSCGDSIDRQTRQVPQLLGGAIVPSLLLSATQQFDLD